MASVKFRLGIQSSTTSSDKLDFSVEKHTPVTTPYMSLARLDVLHTSAAVFQGTGNPDCMLYVKNLDSTNFIEVLNNADEVMSIVLPNMFVLIGVPATAGIKLQADTATCKVEAGFWSMP